MSKKQTMSPRVTEDYNEEIRFIMWIILLIIRFIIWWTSLVGHIQFEQMLKLMIIKKRYPNIVLFESILTMLVPLSYTPYVTFISKLKMFKQYEDILHFWTWITYPICHGVIFCEVCRLWLICFDINYSHSSKNNQWKSQINIKYGEKNWWLNHKKTFGNYEYVTKRMLIWGILSGILSSIVMLTFGHSQLTVFIDGCLFGFPVLLIIYSYYICPKISMDKFLFELEFKSTVIIFCICLFIYFIAMTIYFFDSYIGEILIALDASIAFSFVSILSTLWIPKQILRKMEWFDEYYNNDGNLHNLEDIKNHNQLQNIFSDHSCIELFALHLNQEFSLECILAFIEMIQFKQYFNKIYFGNKQDFVFVDDTKIKFDFGNEFELKSSIVYETVNIDLNQNETEIIKHFKLIAYFLYEKYLIENSELEINISGIYRSQFDKLMGNKYNWMYNVQISGNDLLNIFDQTCAEMFMLMEYSFERFKISEEYKKLIQSRN